jgi:hypothetical protein
VTRLDFSTSSSFPPVNIIPPWLSILIYHLWGLTIGGRSSETPPST